MATQTRANKVFDAATKRLEAQRNGRFSRADYGSRLRDGAGLLALAAEAGGAQQNIQLAGLAVETERASTTYTSTQENAWMVLAAEALSKDAQAISLSVDRWQGGIGRALSRLEIGGPRRARCRDHK